MPLIPSKSKKSEQLTPESNDARGSSLAIAYNTQKQARVKQSKYYREPEEQDETKPSSIAEAILRARRKKEELESIDEQPLEFEEESSLEEDLFDEPELPSEEHDDRKLSLAQKILKNKKK